jgi:hypothetical protein
MTNTAYYRAWYPILEHRGTGASIILTQGASRRAPVGGRLFFEALLELSGITGELVAWGTHPFMSAYFSKGEWQESWDVKLILSDATREHSDQTIAGAEVFVEPESEEPPGKYLPVRVLADFTRRRPAEQCRAELKKRAANAEWNELHYEGYSIRDVGPQHKQLVVNVCTGERSEFAHIIDTAGTVAAVCEQHGGRTQAP